ncbi:ABC transporter ATP-binding protein [Rhizobium sp. SSA_523]|uniref:ABC transporter ATP-binding protein n=1 Tax=Rhizobium sp. SSA_523 TaxID=2952477 RepID=UPI002091BFE7|nr:ABC transporter ATP-binding protein [Rhizobium sp. SSA_523]MCO5731256.1 ABC transporter ATP-binding protein/permease [Rhizobium sp. SSA_523]WKC22206.1 ABC transporter ATP-binding protein [Rhizobium sp. SSA_523]
MAEITDKRIWPLVAPVRRPLLIAILLSALGSALGLAAFGLLGFAVTLTATGSLSDMPWLPFGAGVALALSCLLRLKAFDVSHQAAFRLEVMLRERLTRHLAELSLGRIEQTGSSMLAKVIFEDVKALHVVVADSIPLAGRAYILPPLTFLLLLGFDWRFALAAAGVILAGFAVMSLAMRDHVAITARYNQAREAVSAAIVEFIQAMPVVRSFDSGSTSFSRYHHALDAYLTVVTQWYRDASLSARSAFALLNPLPTLFVLLLLALHLSSREPVELGSFLMILLLGAGMAEAILPMMMLNHMVNKARINAARINQVLAFERMAQPASAALPVPARAEIVFDEVSLRYAGGADALTQISFIARPGTVTALVGPSGAGKTSLARLIPRFLDVTSGTIRIGGVDLREVDRDSLMRRIGFVFQEPYLFSGSIADNIRLGASDRSDEAVVAAAKAAQLHDFVNSLPQAYATELGELGARLSGGQRQRLCLARAILQDRPILILDEVTSFADPDHEEAMIRALARLRRDKTIIVVSHRLATITQADQILLLEKGRIVEAGPHEALLAAAGSYSRLWAAHLASRDWALAGERDGAPC